MVSGASTFLPLDLTRLRVAITGAASGIGRVMADGFTACGGRVFISDVDAAALAASGHDGMIADAGEAAAMEAFVDGAVTRLGGLDVLVNNAGIAGPTAPVERVTPAELEETLRVDLAAMFHCSRRTVQALPQLGRRTLRFCAPQPLRRREMGRRRFYQDACHRARPRLHQRQRDPTRTGRRSADQTSPEGKGGSERDRGERANRARSEHGVAPLLRHPARHREYGALSLQPVRAHHQRPSPQRGRRHTGPDVTASRAELSRWTKENAVTLSDHGIRTVSSLLRQALFAMISSAMFL